MRKLARFKLSIPVLATVLLTMTLTIPLTAACGGDQAAPAATQTVVGPTAAAIPTSTPLAEATATKETQPTSAPPSPTAAPSPSTLVPTPVPTEKPETTLEPTATPQPTPTSTPAATPTPTPVILPETSGIRIFQDPDLSYLNWEVDDKIPDPVFYDIRQGFALMHQYGESFGLPEYEEEVNVYVYEDLAPVLAGLRGTSEEEERQSLERNPSLGTAGLNEEGVGEIFFHLPESLRKSVVRDHVIRNSAHELMHVYQFVLAAYRNFSSTHTEVRVHGPAWLIEGITELQAIRSLAIGDPPVYVYEERRERDSQVAGNVTTDLAQMETFQGFLSTSGGYRLAEMAAELLAAKAGEEALITYWTLLGPETHWQEAFEEAFDMTVNEFYQSFEEHRAAGFPEVGLLPLGLSVEDLPQEDRPALVALYNATNGTGWVDDSNWLSDAPIGRWHGVTVDVNGRVTELHLGGNGLRGELPPEMGKLAELTTLILWGNALTGSIPGELGNLTKLNYFYIAGNSLLTGCIPSELRDVPLHDLTNFGLRFCEN